MMSNSNDVKKKIISLENKMIKNDKKNENDKEKWN